MKKIAAAFSEYCSSNCQLFSTYTNRFAFYLQNYNSKNEITEFCKAIASTLESILFIERINGSIGIYEMSGFETDVEQISKNALIASENASYNADRNFSYCFFDAEMESQLLRKEQIINELSQIAAGANISNLYLQFQPIFDLHSQSIYGFEALARLRSDKLGLISPLEFIPIAEKTKLIIPIGKTIMHQACSFLSKLNSKGFTDFNISINVSAIQLLRQDFHHDLFELIDKMNINPTNITLEITESVFSDNYHEINKKLGELKTMGIHIAIDDFGTGYSSLARERELNIDYLKIDKSFIDNLIINQKESITSDIISMAHKLGHCVIAEGVELEQQKQYLQDCDCDKIQGYLISKPLSLEQAMMMLEEEEIPV
jgi:EAL domain-containing protein (putative c-di-GMP-specific phosphodiesterase class I)